MNTGPRTQAAFIRGKQSKDEHNASQSALLYLFQEVSKLSSTTHNSFLDTKPPPKWADEASKKDPVVVKREEEVAHQIQHNFSHMFPYNEVKRMKGESHSSKLPTLAKPQCETSSPWKVLSLINLHCERLLHQTDAEEFNPSSVSSTTQLFHSTARLSKAAPKGVVGGDNVSVEYTSGPSLLLYERQEITARSVDDIKGGSTGYKLQHCMKDAEVKCSVQLQASEKRDTVRAELLEESVSASFQLHRFKREVKFNVDRELKWDHEDGKDCSSSEEDPLDLSLSENALSQTHISSVSPVRQLTFDSKDEANVALYKPTLSLDHNANPILSAERPCDTQQRSPSSAMPASQSVSLIFSTAESCHSLSKQSDKISASRPECTHVSPEEKSPPAAVQLESSVSISSASSKPELWTLQKEKLGLPSTRQWKTKTPRKQPHPCRSTDSQDPDFQGVTFRMDTELDDSREQCRLLITSKYSKELCKTVRKPRVKIRTSQKSLKTNISEEKNDPATQVLKSKVCASCYTRKTPMWRDAEDGTPLCNACGIRYKKYRVRCVNCWHIPRKEDSSNSCCLKCGNFVRLTSAQQKRTA